MPGSGASGASGSGSGGGGRRREGRQHLWQRTAATATMGSTVAWQQQRRRGRRRGRTSPRTFRVAKVPCCHLRSPRTITVSRAHGGTRRAARIDRDRESSSTAGSSRYPGTSVRIQVLEYSCRVLNCVIIMSTYWLGREIRVPMHFLSGSHWQLHDRVLPRKVARLAGRGFARRYEVRATCPCQ